MAELAVILTGGKRSSLGFLCRFMCLGRPLLYLYRQRSQVFNGNSCTLLKCFFMLEILKASSRIVQGLLIPSWISLVCFLTLSILSPHTSHLVEGFASCSQLLWFIKGFVFERGLAQMVHLRFLALSCVDTCLFSSPFFVTIFPQSLQVNCCRGESTGGFSSPFDCWVWTSSLSSLVVVTSSSISSKNFVSSLSGSGSSSSSSCSSVLFGELAFVSHFWLCARGVC